MKGYVELKGYEGLYEINRSGIVKNIKGDILSPFLNKDNYKKITLC